MQDLEDCLIKLARSSNNITALPKLIVESVFFNSLSMKPVDKNVSLN